MSSTALLIVYSLAIVLASLVGGWIPLLFRLTHQRMQLALSFVAGAMLGVAMLHLVPHALVKSASIDAVMMWTLVGFLGMFFVERFFAFHHHDIAEDEVAHEHHAHEHHDQHSAGELSWGGAAIGLSLHALTDGLALAASVQAEATPGVQNTWAGLATFLVIFLHKPFDSLTIGTLMAAAGWSKSARHGVNLAFALLIPLGGALFVAGLDVGGDQQHRLLGAALAFSAGTFLCIATSDLLPELQFHRHDRVKLSAALLLGLAAAWAIGLVEHHGHNHDAHGAGSHHVHDHPDHAQSK